MEQVTVYHKDYCPYCKGARQILDAAGIAYKAVDVSHSPAAFSEMVARSKRRTVPQIFFEDRHIGGFDDLQQYIRQHGELPTLHEAEQGEVA